MKVHVTIEEMSFLPHNLRSFGEEAEIRLQVMLVEYLTQQVAIGELVCKCRVCSSCRKGAVDFSVAAGAKCRSLTNLRLQLDFIV